VSIQNVANGKKRGDPTKTGQFGLGFNSVYHITDTPIFLTGKVRESELDALHTAHYTLHVHTAPHRFSPHKHSHSHSHRLRLFPHPPHCICFLRTP